MEKGVSPCDVYYVHECGDVTFAMFTWQELSEDEREKLLLAVAKQQMNTEAEITAIEDAINGTPKWSSIIFYQGSTYVWIEDDAPMINTVDDVVSAIHKDRYPNLIKVTIPFTLEELNTIYTNQCADGSEFLKLTDCFRPL